jgi:hypothetical protein
MNTQVERSIVSAQTLTPILKPLIATQLNFLVWSKQNVEIYDGMIDAVSQAGFYVIVLKNVADIARKIREAQHNALINDEPIELIDDELVNEVLTAKAAGKKVAVMFHEVERFSEEALLFLAFALTDKRIAHVELDKNDLIFATGNMNDKGNPDFPENIYRSSRFDMVSARFMNYRYE